MVKDATEYSTPWKAVNIKAKPTVKTNAYKPAFLFAWINEWCE